MYKRSEYQVIMNRLKEQRKFIQVVMGTRQIGKPTVIKQVLKDSDMKKRITTYFIGILALAMLCSGCSTNRMAAGDPGAVLAGDRKSTRLNSSHMPKSRMPSSA